jgi:hypothetical protein
MKHKSRGRTQRPRRPAGLQTLLDTPPWDWPEDAGNILEGFLANPKAGESDRLVAAELAGDLVVLNDALADALLGIVGNAAEPDPLRATSASSLGPVLEEASLDEFDDPDSVPITRDTFQRIERVLHELYLDHSIPTLVRRRILEASVRSPQDWHKDAISVAYSSGDQDWILTAVFSMRYVRGFDDQILEALRNKNAAIHREAVHAAGNWELSDAWSHIVALVDDPATPKPLLLAAIGAIGSIRPKEAGEILDDLSDSDDEEIAEAAQEAISFAQGYSELADEDEDEDEWIN